MGLDMYLYKITYTNVFTSEGPERARVNVTLNGKDTSIKSERVVSVKEEIGYWRKANHIHQWFVNNIQDSKDDCDEYYVNLQDLIKLKDDCLKVLNDRTPENAQAILPTQEGFFFGDTSYDEHYYSVTENTVKIIDSIMDDDFDETLTSIIIYQSSW